MSDLEYELSNAARHVSVGFGDLDEVMATGKSRRQRRRRVISSVTSVALVAGLAVVVNNLNQKSATPVAALGSGTRGDAGLHWEVLSTSDGLGMSGLNNDVTGVGPYYALSTAAGRADVNSMHPSRVLWRSDDGINWTAATTFGNDLFASDLAPTDGRVYAVGTAPAQAGVQRRGDLVAGWSDDGGKTFSKTALPVDWSAIEAGSTSTILNTTQVAASKKGTVVTAAIGSALNVPKLLPDGVTAPDGWAVTANGVDILGPDHGTQCPAGTESPIEAKRAAAGKLEGKRIVVSGSDAGDVAQPKSREIEPTYCLGEGDDGQSVSVSPQESRGVVRSVTWDEMHVTGDLLAAATHQTFAFFAPANSTDFSRVDLGNVPTDNAYLDADEDGFHLFASGGSNGTTPVRTTDLRSSDGRTWTSIAGPTQMRWISAAGSVNGVRTVVGEGADGTMVARSTGDGTWVETSLAAVVDPAHSGGKPVHVSSAGIGPLGVVVSAFTEVDKGDAQQLLIFSRDGQTWEDQPASKIAGHAVGMTLRVFVTGQRAVVALSGGSTNEGADPKPQTILVATPA